MLFNESDIFFMREAYSQSLRAKEKNEIPIGAVLVKDGKIIGKAHNCTITNNDPSAHAEVLAIRMGAEKLNNYRLNDTKLYVTLEPCIMCLGVLVQARVQELIYATPDSRVGVFSRKKYYEDKDLNHNLSVRSGLMQKECKNLLKDFFLERRSK
nr:tRNA adenosine(34) deaminase TadA [Pseudofrancisella aestuarii]